ncbi:unnamed protein product, partial [Brassica oleracea var. botrytis]
VAETKKEGQHREGDTYGGYGGSGGSGGAGESRDEAMTSISGRILRPIIKPESNSGESRFGRKKDYIGFKPKQTSQELRHKEKREKSEKNLV